MVANPVETFRTGQLIEAQFAFERGTNESLPDVGGKLVKEVCELYEALTGKKPVRTVVAPELADVVVFALQGGTLLGIDFANRFGISIIGDMQKALSARTAMCGSPVDILRDLVGVSRLLSEPQRLDGKSVGAVEDAIVLSLHLANALGAELPEVLGRKFARNNVKYGLPEFRALVAQGKTPEQALAELARRWDRSRDALYFI